MLQIITWVILFIYNWKVVILNIFCLKNVFWLLDWNYPNIEKVLTLEPERGSP